MLLNAGKPWQLIPCCELTVIMWNLRYNIEVHAIACCISWNKHGKVFVCYLAKLCQLQKWFSSEGGYRGL